MLLLSAKVWLLRGGSQAFPGEAFLLGLEVWTRETREVWNQIWKHVRRLRNRGHERRAPEIVDALLLWQYGLAKDEKKFEGRRARKVDPKFVEYCWRCASATYGFAVLKPLGMLPGYDLLGTRCPEIQVTRPLRKANAKVPAFFVGYGPRGVVVAIRGTADPGDVALDLDCDDIGSHAGIFKAAKSIARDAKEAIITALHDAPRGTPLVFTGHSLGAGVALLLAVVDLGPDVDTQLRRGHHPVRAVAFAPPPVLNTKSSSSSSSSPGRRRRRRRFETFIVGDDVVPDLSLASVTAFAQQLDALDASLPPRTRFELLLRRAVAAVGKPHDRQQADNAIIAAVDKALRRHRRRRSSPDGDDTDDDPVLSLPGTVFRLDRDGTTCVELRKPYVPAIHIHRASLIDHFLPTIDAAIAAWAKDSVSCSSTTTEY